MLWTSEEKESSELKQGVKRGLVFIVWQKETVASQQKSSSQWVGKEKKKRNAGAKRCNFLL